MWALPMCYLLQHYHTVSTGPTHGDFKERGNGKMCGQMARAAVTDKSFIISNCSAASTFAACYLWKKLCNCKCSILCNIVFVFSQ